MQDLATNQWTTAGKLQNSPEIWWFAWVTFCDLGQFCAVWTLFIIQRNASTFIVYLSKKKLEIIPLWIVLKLPTHMKNLHTYLFGLTFSTHVLSANGNSSTDLLKSRVSLIANLRMTKGLLTRSKVNLKVLEPSLRPKTLVIQIGRASCRERV